MNFNKRVDCEFNLVPAELARKAFLNTLQPVGERLCGAKLLTLLISLTETIKM